jgi:hypothetical protein
VIEGTLAMLRARRDERAAVAGLIAALFCDDVGEAVRRLDLVAASAAEHERTLPARSRARNLVRDVASAARDLRAPVVQLAALNGVGS